MRRTAVSTKHWLYDLIGAGLAIAVGLGALAVRPLGLWLEEWSYDLPYALRPNRPTAGLVVVSMDAASRGSLAQPDEKRWDRQLHARLLDRLVARGARAAVFMTVFSEASPTNSTDRLFAQALRRARGKVVLAGTRVTGTNQDAVLSPTPELAAAAPWGMLAGPSGTDPVIRRYGTPDGNPTLAARLVQLLGQPLTNSLASQWFNYYAPQLALPEVSYEQVLLGTEPSGILKGKIVIVGPLSKDSELVPTPYTRWTGRRAPRAEVEATAILNLLRRESLSRLPSNIETGILIVAGGFLGLAFMGRRRSAAALLAVGAATLATVGACVLVTYSQFWFPWLAVVGVQIPMALGWAWLCEAVDRAQEPALKLKAPPPNLTSTPAPNPVTSPAARPGVQPATTVDSPGIPDHTLLKCIGRGAYGEVWLVRDVIGRYHAVKIVKARNFPQAAPYEREFKGIEHFAPIFADASRIDASPARGATRRSRLFLLHHGTGRRRRRRVSIGAGPVCSKNTGQ